MEPYKAYQESVKAQEVYDTKQAEADKAHQAKQAQIEAASVKAQQIWEIKNRTELSDRLGNIK